MIVAALSLLAVSQAPSRPLMTKVGDIPPLDASNSVPFAIPYDDAPNGGATDASFLNVMPAGKNGRIVARDGHFVEEGTGKPIRFFATNLGARAAFPNAVDAEKIAARLAKSGVNLVRIHHLQNGWDTNGGMIWKEDKVYLDIDPKQLDVLDRFVAALIRHGIYVNLNLTTARVYQPEQGFPEVVKTLEFSKRIDKFNRRMIALQKQYAKGLLDRENPYLGRKYKDEPGLMIVEINNENSLVGAPWEGLGSGLDAIPEPFLGQLKTLWSAWLKKTYGTDAKLRAAWDQNEAVTGPSLVGPDTTWSTENQSNGDLSFTTEPSGTGSAPVLKGRITANPGPDWHVQAHLNGLTLENGKNYTVTFRGSASTPSSILVDAGTDQPDWRNIGLAAGIRLEPTEREYAVSFRAHDAVPGHARVGFVLGNARGDIAIRDLKIREGRVGAGLPAGESIAKGNVSFPSADGSKRGNDWLDFLTATETAYSNEMRSFLRNDLGFKRTNLLDSQTSWGGLTSLSREAGSSYDDTHAYWNHPNFIGGSWNPKNYVVNRAAITQGLPGLGALADLAVWRRFDRPFSVSEYDHPAPSDYVAEMMPLFSAFAAHQGWDAIYTFAWEPTGAGMKNDAMEGYFDQARNPAKVAFYPAAALLFRQGLLDPPAYRQTLMVAGEKPWHDAATPWAQWGLAEAKPDFFGAQVGYLWKPEAKKTVVISNRAAPSRTMRVMDGEGGKILVASSDRALSVGGFTNGARIEFPGGSLAYGSVPAGLTGTMLVPVDGKPLAESKRMLLTSIGRAENVGMAWNAERNSVSDKWGTGPVRAETVPLTLSLAGKATLYVLDPSGRRVKGFPLDATTDRGTIVLGAPNTPHPTATPPFVPALPQGVWYEIVRE